MKILVVLALLAILAAFGALYLRFCKKLADEVIRSVKFGWKTSHEGGEAWPEVEYEDDPSEDLEHGDYDDASTDERSLFHCGMGFCWKI